MLCKFDDRSMSMAEDKKICQSQVTPQWLRPQHLKKFTQWTPLEEVCLLSKFVDCNCSLSVTGNTKIFQSYITNYLYSKAFQTSLAHEKECLIDFSLKVVPVAQIS